MFRNCMHILLSVGLVATSFSGVVVGSNGVVPETVQSPIEWGQQEAAQLPLRLGTDKLNVVCVVAVFEAFDIAQGITQISLFQLPSALNCLESAIRPGLDEVYAAFEDFIDPAEAAKYEKFTSALTELIIETIRDERLLEARAQGSGAITAVFDEINKDLKKKLPAFIQEQMLLAE